METMHGFILVAVLLFIIFAYIAIVEVPKHNKPVPEKNVIAKAEILLLSDENEEAIEILESYLERYPNQEKAVYLLNAAKKAKK